MQEPRESHLKTKQEDKLSIGLLTRSQIGRKLDLGLLAFTTMRNKCPLFKPLILPLQNVVNLGYLLKESSVYVTFLDCFDSFAFIFIYFTSVFQVLVAMLRF